MLGFCGDDTTISSFSQQTFHLVRDDELTPAASNITLSVTLRLIAVTGGHYAAAALNRLEAP